MPPAEKEILTTPEKVVDEIFDEIDDNQDGVITKQELVKAVERSAHLTTIVIDKIIMRFSCACISILDQK